MPRIEAETIEAHVAQQTDRILNAAGELFRNKGYVQTDMAEIAASIGLARNSLYRYYSSKDHILVACMQRDMEPYATVVEELRSRYPNAVERVQAWLDLQIEMATGPCHMAMELVGEARTISDDVRWKIADMHAPQQRVIETAVKEMLAGTRRDAALVTAMIASMVHSASKKILEHGNKEAVLGELKRCVISILTAQE